MTDLRDPYQGDTMHTPPTQFRPRDHVEYRDSTGNWIPAVVEQTTLDANHYTVRPDAHPGFAMFARPYDLRPLRSN